MNIKMLTLEKFEKLIYKLYQLDWLNYNQITMYTHSTN